MTLWVLMQTIPRMSKQHGALSLFCLYTLASKIQMKNPKFCNKHFQEEPRFGFKKEAQNPNEGVRNWLKATMEDGMKGMKLGFK